MKKLSVYNKLEEIHATKFSFCYQQKLFTC